LFKLDQLQESRIQFDRLLSLQPHNIIALNERGSVLAAMKEYEAALASIEKALDLNPQYAEAYLNKANLYSEMKRYDEALTAFSRTLALKPDLAEAWLGHGNVFHEVGRYNDAFSAYEKALVLKPDLAEGWLGRGNAFTKLNRLDEAIVSFEKALALDPNLVDAWIGYGQVLGMSERANEAVAAYRQASKLGAAADLVGYLLAGLGAGSPPIASPKDYIIEQFDSYAENFDLKLVQELKYQVPIILSAAIKPFVYPSDPDALDLGCGTGLMGVSLRPFVRTLTGIDLSSKMLKKAEQRGMYDHLICCDIIEFLSTQEKSFDLAVAADVFVYFGNLLPVFQAVRRVIRDNGFFCISIEATEENDFVLRRTLRYAHSKSYVEQTARNNQFAVRYMDPLIIRQETGKNIDGYIAIMQCI
jgi:predicted TPR repeat methyltransferase